MDLSAVKGKSGLPTTKDKKMDRPNKKEESKSGLQILKVDMWIARRRYMNES